MVHSGSRAGLGRDPRVFRARRWYPAWTRRSRLGRGGPGQLPRRRRRRACRLRRRPGWVRRNRLMGRRPRPPSRAAARPGVRPLPAPVAPGRAPTKPGGPAAPGSIVPPPAWTRARCPSTGHVAEPAGRRRWAQAYCRRKALRTSSGAQFPGGQQPPGVVPMCHSHGPGLPPMMQMPPNAMASRRAPGRPAPCRRPGRRSGLMPVRYAVRRPERGAGGRCGLR